MFDRDRFVADCIASLDESDPQAAIHEHLARAVSDHAGVLTAMGEPTEAGFDILIASPRLTIFAAKWAPNMTLSPHNHLMWALIGIYTGREDNIFWKRTDNGLRAGGASALFAGDVASLPRDVIHSVTNPLGRFTAGLHIYGGDFSRPSAASGTPRHWKKSPPTASASAQCSRPRTQSCAASYSLRLSPPVCERPWRSFSRPPERICSSA